MKTIDEFIEQLNKKYSFPKHRLYCKRIFTRYYMKGGKVQLFGSDFEDRMSKTSKVMCICSSTLSIGFEEKFDGRRHEIFKISNGFFPIQRTWKKEYKKLRLQLFSILRKELTATLMCPCVYEQNVVSSKKVFTIKKDEKEFDVSEESLAATVIRNIPCEVIKQSDFIINENNNWKFSINMPVKDFLGQMNRFL